MSEPICVIKNKQFSETAKRLNISEAALERIVHKYINELEDAEAFPSDSYIRAQYTVSNIVNKSDLDNLTAVWEEHFASPVRVETLQEAVLLRDNAAQYFKEEAISVKPLNDGTFQVIVAKPRTATSNKGNVSGPIVYNAEQEAAIDAAVKHINSVRAGTQKQKFFTIQGKAGTGKTTIVNEILNRMQRGTYSRPVVIMGALSHKATTVLKGKINDEVAKNFTIQNKTIAGMLGMRPTNEGTFEPIPGIVPPIQRASVVFIDEASMVNEEQLELILNAIKGKSIPVMFLGDVGQLPPVRSGRYYARRKIASDKLSPVFEDESIPSASLVTRVRQGESSPVLEYADGYWNFSQGQRQSYPNDLQAKSRVTDRGALIVQREEVDLVQQLLPLFEEAKRTGNPNLVKIVPYTNNSTSSKESAVDRYNRLIRKALYPNSTSEGFEKGDLIIFNDTYGSENSSIPNSFESAVVDVRPCESSLPQFDGVELEEVEREYITFDTPYGKAVVPALVPTRANRLKHQRNLTKIAQYCKANRHAWPRFWDYKNLYAANIGYAYAIDSHKSQGSTYEVVAVDAADINSVQPTTLKTKAQSIYTALTRASNVTIVSSNTTNESTVYTDIKAINDRINAVKAGQAVEKEFTPATEEDSFSEVTEDDLDKLIKDPEKKLKRVKKKGNIEEDGINPVVEHADTPEVEEGEGEEWGEDEDEDEGDDEDEAPQPKKSETPQQKTYREFISAQRELNSVIKFKQATHTYIVNGVKADFSVTEFRDFLFGESKDVNDFLEISSRLGNTHDAFLRDFFAEEVKDSYPNLSAEQIKKLTIQAAKLEVLLTKTFGEDAIFITDENLLRIAAKVAYNGKEYTVAGTMDMVVIDRDGKIHIIDFKTKRANVSEELDSDKLEGYGLQISMYKAFVASNPLFKSRMGKAQIAQFNLRYADPRTNDYSFKGEQIYIEVDGEVVKLQEARKGTKVPYTSGVFNNKLLGLSVNLSEEGIKVSPVKTDLQRTSSQREVDRETRVEPRKGKGQMVEFYGSQKRPDIKAASTFGAILEGKRTSATKHKYWDYWKQFKVGDIITFTDVNGKTVDVRITVAPHKLTRDTDPEEWSKKEGWTVEKFNKDVLPYIKRGEAFQMEFEPVERETPSSIEVNSFSKKFGLLSNFGEKEFVIDGKTFPTVEHYFQWAKAIHCKDYAMANKILKATSAKQAKYFGGNLLNMSKAQIASWDKMSRNVMKKGMREAFEQNDDAKTLLLSTGTALLTHKLGGPFAEVLMELREEFGGVGKPETAKEVQKRAKEEAEKRTEIPVAPNKKGTTQNLNFSESKGSYAQRTREVISWSDVTLAIAADGETPGERLTEKEAVQQNKFANEYLPNGLETNDIPRRVRNMIVGMENDQSYGHKGTKLPTKNIKLNIAGNGIYTLTKFGISQEQINEYVYQYLKELINQGVTISEIKTGGQTGVDEAGIIAAQRLGIKWSVNAPKGWKFRDAEGKDHEDEEAFKARFGSQTSEWTRRGEKQLKISTEGYRKGDPQSNPDVAYVFTENAEAYSYANSIDLEPMGVEFPLEGSPKINVSDVRGTNQAGIRTDADGNISENAFGIVVKKYQQNKDGKFVAQEGTFSDTEEDFELFTSLNKDMFRRLDKSGLKKMIFPSQMALGKAALPKRFAEWLAEELKTRYGVISTIQENENSDYEGYGLSIDSIQEKKVDSSLHVEKLSDRYTPKTSSDVEQFNTAAEALRKQGWHVEFYSKKSKTSTPKAKAGDTPFIAALRALGRFDVVDLRVLTSDELKEKDKSLDGWSSLTKQSKIKRFLYNATKTNYAIDANLPEDASDSLKNQLAVIKEHNDEAEKANVTGANPRASSEEVKAAAKSLHDQEVRVANFIRDVIKEYYGIDAPTLKNTLHAKETQEEIAAEEASTEPAYINDVMTISIEGNPRKGFFELVKDAEENNYSVHFKTKSKKAMNESEFAEEALEDSEKEDMFKALIYAIPEGGVVSTWGTLSKGGIAALDSLARRSGGALQKIGDKLAKDSEGNDTRIPVYKKLSEDELAEANVAKVRKATAIRRATGTSQFHDDFFGVVSAEQDDRFTGTYTLTLGSSEMSIIDGSKNETLRSLIEDMPYSALLSIDTSKVDANFLYTLDELLHNPTLHAVPTEQVITIDPDSAEGMIAKEYAKAGKKLQYDSKTGELHIPQFTVGYTIGEIEKRAAYNRMINNDLLTQEELRNLSKATMYKLSEFITIIQSYRNGYETLFGKKTDKDFTKMSRIDIIKEVGLKNLLLKVRERVFDSNNALEDTSFDTLDKMDIIFNNWDAFVELGYDTLIGLEEIALDSRQGVRQDIKNDLNSVMEEDDESIIQEMFGSSLEHWQVGFRQVSAFSSLSKLIKRTLDSLYELDQDGNKIIDEYGIAKHLDAQTAVSKILYFTQGAQSLDDVNGDGELRSNSMLYMLKKQVNAEPWLQQIVELLEGKYDEEGNLVKAADEQFKAQFYSNFKKYFQKYCITFKDKSGKVLIKTINESQYSDTLLKESQAKENSFAMGDFKLKNKDGSINEGNLKRLKELAATMEKFADKAEFKGKLGELLDLGKYHKALKEIFDLLDISTPADESLFNLFGVKKNLKNFSRHLSYLVEAIKEGVTVTNNRDYKQIVSLVAKEMGLEMESVSYEAGKMYYSYVLPSYLGRLVTKLKSENMSDTEYREFLQNEYLKYRWFRTEKGKVRCHWLNRLMRSEEVRNNFEHVTSLHYLGTDYSSKTPMEYIASMMRMYFYDNNKRWAYFRVPMLSNKPSEEYIKFERLSTATVGDWRQFIVDKMQDVFTQELDRIQAVRERQGNIREDQKIVSKGKKGAFDKRGLEFVFEDYLQKYLDGTYSQRPEYKQLSKEEKIQEARFSKLLNAKLDGTINDTNAEYGELMTLFRDMTKRGFEENYQLARQQWVDEGFLTLNEDGTIKKVAGDMKLSEEDLREFFWNDAFAATQILELTITDMAYYVDTEDLQKRLAQLHAPGMQAHIQAKDRNGKLYTKDGIERTIYIQDAVVKAQMLKNLKLAVEQIVADTPKDRRAAVRKQLSGIVKAFEKVNFADAQGYSCPSSYRKKMGIFGNWDDRMEDAYEKVTHPEKYPDVNLSDMLDVLWQPLKPFVYSQIAKPGYNSTLPELKVSVQNKNSEYVLVMADALLQRAGIPNKLRAIYEFMEASQHDSEGNLNGEGIDTIQFMSAVNAGCTGVIDLNDIVNSDGSITYLTEDEVKERLAKAYEVGEDGSISYSRDYVHEIPFEDYIIQQNVPAHFMEHEQAHGSQDRILTFADMLDTDPATGETNYLTIDGKQVSVAQAKADYFKAIADNIEESKQELIRRFKLGGSDRAVNVAISKVLKDTILKDSRYGSDLLWACDTNEFGEFNIPLSDPIQSNRIQQLLNSIIKNTINKQEIAGGPVVQVSNWGTSTQLAIRFKDGFGELLLTEREFNELKAGHTDSPMIPKDYNSVDSEGNRKWASIDGSDTYEDYISNQAGVAYYEALVPIPNENFAKDFMKKDANGNEYIDVEEIEKTNPDLLYMIGYRIPTESKYSMVPIKVKGFLPRVGGEGVMLPAEITSQAGSDFDIDKEYIMTFVFDRIEKDGKVIYEKPKSGRGYRNNLIVATQLAVLQSEQVQKQLFTPGNFDEPKKYGYLISYVQNEAARTGRDPEEVWKEAMEQGSGMTVDDFNDWLKQKNKTSKNLIFNNVQVQFHKQNMTAGKLIGIFAQANVSHAFISLEDNTNLQIPEEMSFTINGIHVGGSFAIDEVLSRDRSVNISNNLAALLAASVDAVKDPILNLINININTANMVTSMLRMGFSLETVSLLVSQPIIKDLIKDYAIQRAEKYVDLHDLIEDVIDAMPEDIKQIDDIAVTSEDLIANLNGNSAVTNYMVMRIFERMQAISDTFGDITHMTRYNSVTSAVGPFASDTMLQKTKDDAFIHNPMIGEGIKRACDNPILYAFRESAFDIEGKLLGEHLIQAGKRFETALNTLGRTLGFNRGVPSKVANSFSDFFMSFYVNDSEDGSVFDLGIENRRYMLTKFPKDFLRLKKKYKDNLLINSIQYTESDREQYPYLQLRTRGLNSTALEDVKNAWITLYNDPNSRDLAIRLVEYNYFRGSFGFNPKTFMSLVPNVIKTGLSGYINTLNKKDSRVETCDRTNRIIYQFILHNPDLIIDRYYKLENYNPTTVTDDVYGDCIEVNKEPSESKRKKYKLKASRPFIKIDDKTYFVVKNNFAVIDGSDSLVLKEVDELGGNGQGFEISTDEDFPKSIFDSNFKATKKEGYDRGGDYSFSKDGMIISGEKLGVVIEQFFNRDEIQELTDLKIPRAIDRINERLDEQDYGVKISKAGRMQKRLEALLEKVDGIDNPSEVLNKSNKTIDDLDLCRKL